MEFVRGVDEVTVWMWPNSADSVTVRLPLRQWAKLERTAEKTVNGDVERVVGKLLQQDMMSDYL
ncbi:hypothetical protein DVK01_20950 [Haloarcula sp. Atlit-120R]|nr:hypothetical protein DVK01_20950 [Haloarcula sp. Atlit-120R]